MVKFNGVEQDYLCEFSFFLYKKLTIFNDCTTLILYIVTTNVERILFLIIIVKNQLYNLISDLQMNDY